MMGRQHDECSGNVPFARDGDEERSQPNAAKFTFLSQRKHSANRCGLHFRNLKKLLGDPI
jgi:hypothetical protein